MALSVVLAIDQGTTGTRAAIYDQTGRCLGSSALELTQHYPQPGWVEHDPEEIWQAVATVVPRALAAAELTPDALAAIGITNQRESIVLWERATGRPVSRVLVWQDRRTADFCRQRHADEPWIAERTGLVLDPYFSATKLHWLLAQDPSVRAAAESGQLACGTIDSYLLWRLTGGRTHATDVTNASRTLLLNLQTARWDDDLCAYFGIPQALLPEVRPSAADYGVTTGLDFLPNGIPLGGVAGDQQAALFGQLGFAAGDAKCTYGTGAFFLLHTGSRPLRSRHRLLSTLAATIDDQPQYALEGSVFIAGAAVQWLRDGLDLFEAAAEIEELAARSNPQEPVLFVPALVGFGAPHWVPEARGVLFGLTRATTGADLARAALEGVGFQVVDLVDAAGRDAGTPLHSLRVDGGMARNALFLQFQADLLGLPVLQSPELETTAMGAAFLAGLRAGVWPNLDSLRQLARQPIPFKPRLPEAERTQRLSQWRRAVQSVIAFYHVQG